MGSSFQIVLFLENQNTGMPTPSNGHVFNITREWRPTWKNKMKSTNYYNRKWIYVTVQLTYFKALNLSFSWEFSGGSQSNDDNAIPDKQYLK